MPKNPLKDYITKDVALYEKRAKSSVALEHDFWTLQRVKWELERDQAEAEKREVLSSFLMKISVIWLGFCGVVVSLYGAGVLRFGESSAVTFIAGSLLEVFGLWKIALNYFFHKK